LFTILRHAEGAEPTEIVVVQTREEGEKFLKRLNELFPGDEYELRESEANTSAAAEP